MADLIAEPAPGYRVAGSGVTGTVVAYDPARADTREGGPQADTAALDAALASTGVSEVKVLEVRASVEPGVAPPTRSDRASGTLRVEVPNLGDTVGQAILAVDEDGAMSWHFPVATAGADGTGRGDSALVFDIPYRDSTAPDDGPAERGLVSVLRKVLKVLVYDLVEDAIGAVGEFFATRWEAKNRPARVRLFAPDSFTDKSVPSLTNDQWRALHGERALLFVHGTFSTAHGGFAGLPVHTLDKLWGAYGGRVVAFDHATVSEDPRRNVERFRELVPPDVDLTFDVVSHSRGGLVARTLAGELDGAVPGVAVRRAVLVGTPNHGTPLTDVAHMSSLLDRVTTGLNLIPPGPQSVVVETLEAIITVVKVLGAGVLGGLDGLQSMHKDGPFIAALKAGGQPAAQYYGIASDFEPAGGLASIARGTVPDAVLDLVFGGDGNDLIVPSLGVSDADDASFPIPADRLVSFDRSRGVWHCDYFSQPDTTDALLEWLLP